MLDWVLIVCQLWPIKNSHAFTIFSLREIEEGASLSVMYTEDGSYFGGEDCQCTSCTGRCIKAPRQEKMDPGESQQEHGGKKQRRRGGRRERARRKGKVARKNELLGS